MPSAHTIDIVFVAFAFLAPAYIVLRFSCAWLTIPLGAVVFWLTLHFSGHLISARDAGRDDMIGHFAGWIVGLIYAFMLYALRRLILFVRNRHRPTELEDG